MPASAPAKRETLTQLIRTEPAEKPVWVDAVKHTGEELRFVGTSLRYNAVAESRDAARENARSQVLKFYGEFIQSQGLEKGIIKGNSGDTLEAMLEREEEIYRFAQSVVSQVKAENYYTEIYLDEQNQESYVVYVLCTVPRKKAETEIQDFPKNVSERYAGAFSRSPASLYDALNQYAAVLEALEKNPLHRAVAYYDAPQGRTGLYEYLIAQSQALAGSLSFEALPNQRAQKNSTFQTTVKLRSSQFERVGPFECRVGISGGQIDPLSANYKVGNSNAFNLQIKTAKLSIGGYQIYLEVPISIPGVSRNMNLKSGFSLDVTEMYAGVRFDGDKNLSEAQKNELQQGLQLGLQNNAVPLRILTQTGNEYVFAISLVPQQSDSDFLVYTITLSIERNGITLRQAEKQNLVEPKQSMRYILSGAAKYLRDNKQFFQEVIALLAKE
jgi:hypothetical protein